ncbi:purine-nucleoside phosphorylase, partial [Trichloromonas sp.]|uniref:purine-nucleoside phosphorylase n=1 Tax=Trichloromonas sp. TaxID=3069249 RepID=UPI003D817AA2
MDASAPAEGLRQRLGTGSFDLAVVLGSGLGALADQVEGSVSIDYRDIPGFPQAQIEGHAGKLVAGRFEGWNVLFFQGRYHLYQGFSASQVALPVRVAKDLGCQRLLLTNAVGGINSAFNPGDFMLIDDHLNLMGDNPLRGETRHPFVDLSRLYLQTLFDPLQSFARQQKIALHRGVLAALMGPSYETPAEIRMLQRLGADAVSMSTVPEAIMGKYLGMDVVGLSLVSNIAAGLAPAPLDHQDVLLTGSRAIGDFIKLARQ